MSTEGVHSGKAWHRPRNGAWGEHVLRGGEEPPVLPATPSPLEPRSASFLRASHQPLPQQLRCGHVPIYLLNRSYYYFPIS